MNDGYPENGYPSDLPEDISEDIAGQIQDQTDGQIPGQTPGQETDSAAAAQRARDQLSADTDDLLEMLLNRPPVQPAAEPGYPEAAYPEPGTMYSGAAQPEAEPEQRMGIFMKIVLWLLVLAVIAFTVFCMWWDVRKGASGGGFYPAGDMIRVQIIQQDRPQDDTPLKDQYGKYTAEGIAETVMPSIVEIYTYSDGRMSGSGSGIILTQDGLIATNAHVISGGDSFSVRLYGDAEKRYTGTVVGHDTKTDLAVLKIAASGLKPAVLGNSDEARLGEAVCALGNPAGLNSSITTGIISGKNRKVRAESTNFEMECFQTDSAISPGNSGGALVNMFGQVIGITSSKYSSRSVFDTGSYEGLGFAITINEALPILTELMEQGYVGGRVRIGIRFLENSAARAQAEAPLPDELDGTGIQIVAIDEDSDLTNTELQPDDWILTMNGREVSDYDSINTAIEGAKAGDTVHCRCGRVREDGSLMTFEIDFRLLEDHSGDY